MKITKVEKSFDLCAESGWFGYYIHLAKPVSDPLIQSLAPLGQLTYMKTLKRPFFLVRTQTFLVRGILGDAFLKVGISQNDETLLQRVQAVIEEAET